MINRILIRIKVVQMLYSYLLTGKEMALKDAIKELQRSMEKSFELYHAIFILMIDITRLQDMKLDFAKNKYLPSEEDMNPNTRFVDNQLVKVLADHEEMREYLKNHPISWKEDDIFLKIMREKILNSEEYAEYMKEAKNDFKSDCQFWRNILKKIILPDEDFAEILESKSVYWNDDIFTISTFVLKTLKRWEDGGERELLPMFKDEEDSTFGSELFEDVVLNKVKYSELIDQFVQKENWDVERLAFMDRVIMMAAISEVLNFPSIPTRVTLNEYIEIAKFYSTNKSSVFVNGMLNAIFNNLRKEGVLHKE